MPAWAMVAAVAIAGLGLAVSSLVSVQLVRERAFDRLLRLTAPAPPAQHVVVVDIGRPLFERFGPWPWSRDRLAALLAAIAEGKPKAVGLDVLLAGADERSAGSLARQLATAADDDRVRGLATSLAAELPDADAVLAEALARVPVVLGVALDDGEPDDLAAPPILFQGQPAPEAFFSDARAIGPPPRLAGAAAGLGALVLPGDADARIRRVPLLLVTARRLRPGLALDVMRVTEGAGSYLYDARAGTLRAGSRSLTLAGDGMLRLRPVAPERRAARVVPAVSVVDDPAVRAGLAGRTVLVGISEPGVGVLQPSAFGDLVPSVQLQADAAEQLATGDLPTRPAWSWWLEALAALVGVGVAMAMGLERAPLAAGIASAAMAAVWLALAWMAARANVLLDPLLVPGCIAAGYVTAAAVTAARTRRREALIRRRFEQHLAPEVVARIVAQPGLLKLEGEAREITAVFTDIEGFTSLTERAGPADLIRLLDRYIEGASRIVVEHGGMVEKIVGDGLHAIFNAPLDLADHPTRALDCAVALVEFAQRMQEEPDARRLGFGRTRVGIETGPVIVGDVGGGRRLDYTAHGNAMNRAARLEAANKELGSSICVGPKAASLMPPGRLRPLGEIALRGVAEKLAVFEPAAPPAPRRSQ